jgi:hypothetical protein
MILKKLKKVIILIIIVKFIIIVFFAFKSDLVSISRDINYNSNYLEGFDNDSIVLQKQRSIRIVRNEEERGISIKLRGKKNTKPFREEEREIVVPIVD